MGKSHKGSQAGPAPLTPVSLLRPPFHPQAAAGCRFGALQAWALVCHAQDGDEEMLLVSLRRGSVPSHGVFCTPLCVCPLKQPQCIPEPSALASHWLSCRSLSPPATCFVSTHNQSDPRCIFGLFRTLLLGSAGWDGSQSPALLLTGVD